jgi:hypothetical protein
MAYYLIERRYVAGAGGGAPGRGEATTDSAKAKIKAASHIVADASLITGAIVQWNTFYLDRAVWNTGRAGRSGLGSLLRLWVVIFIESMM